MDEFSFDTVMQFGKYQGSTVRELIDEEPSYISWLFEKETVTFDNEVIKELEDKKII